MLGAGGRLAAADVPALALLTAAGHRNLWSVTDKRKLEKLVRAEGYLKNTTAGYSPTGPWWKRGMPLLWEVRQSFPGSDERGTALAHAHGLLKDTKKGYDPQAPRWKEAMRLIDDVEASLDKPPIPLLGPVKPGGKAVLLHQLTHDTDGFGGVWPAFDDTLVRVGTPVLAPESCRVIDHTGSDGGVGFKVRGSSGVIHLFLHQASRPAMGQVFLRGEKLSSVAKITADQGGPHIHYALDTRPLINKWLKYGRNGNGPDYTYGSPTIGVQLSQALEV